MLATLASVALALASPLIGLRYDDTGSERRSAPTIVDPRTLKPVEDAPRFPLRADQIERSPDGDTFAALDGQDLVLVSARTGETVGRVPVGPVYDNRYWDPVVSWISANRILVIDKVGARCEPACSYTRVRVVDPVVRTVVGDTLTFAGDFRTARIAGRQLLVVHPYFFPTTDDGGVPRAMVFDATGRIAHRFDLAGFTSLGELDRDLIAGHDRVTGRDVIARIDVRTGTVTEQRSYGIRGEFSSADWLVPAPGSHAWLVCTCNGRGPFDRSPLEAIRPLPERRRHLHSLTRSGYLTLAAERGRSDRRTLTARRLDGRRRWSREVYFDVTVATIGRYVYVEHEHPARGYFIDVIRLRDGRRVAHVRGRRVLSAISAGRSSEQVPRLEGYDTLD